MRLLLATCLAGLALCPATAAAAGSTTPSGGAATPTEGGAHYGETPKVHGLAALPHLKSFTVSRPALTATVSFRIASKLAVRDVRLQLLGGRGTVVKTLRLGTRKAGVMHKVIVSKTGLKAGVVPDPDHGEAAAHRRDRVGQARDRSQAAQAQAGPRARARWAPTCSRSAAPTASAARTPASAPAAPATPTRARTSPLRRARPWWPRTPAA